ncbi:DUF4344 domain-containing metallopeptidase [Marivita sp. S6314]|uniref:DUF4344 domain-containing metallopeptidase n=1 Tax=Marivita sp. S6314 TaxID=2926406 RepID=UPI001FF4DFC2|nr:DUF4344 domain-containing metallopeptidase [Marivita sp. S6314]MCK0150562.1 DUF4344 domain-containing metallopeptidase [Marivita sp. S6314]
MATPVAADEAEDAFVEANIIGIFYHELGHALIDVMQMPVFGQEEDAADVASILLIDQLYEPEFALQMAYDVSDGFWAEAQMNRDTPLPYWDVHGPDEQRFYNTVCLFYGGDPDARDDFAEDMGLPEERAEYCPEEYDLASDSWGTVFEGLGGDGVPMAFRADDPATFTAQLIAAEVEAMNADFLLPTEVVVRAEACGEANAFYDPSDQSITMCEEFEGHLRELYALLNE